MHLCVRIWRSNRSSLEADLGRLNAGGFPTMWYLRKNSTMPREKLGLVAEYHILCNAKYSFIVFGQTLSIPKH